MRFNYNNIKNEILKAILRIKEKHNIIIVGSYALYKIHFNKEEVEINENIEIKDLDIDLYQLNKEFNNNHKNDNNELENELKNTIKNKISLNFYKIIDEIYKYENVKTVNMEFNLNSLSNRPYNKDTKGLVVYLTIEDYEDNEYVTKFDVNLEYKDFVIENKTVEIDKELFNAKVYELHKILADKYLAITKRIVHLHNTKNNNMFNENNLLSNNIKLNKDLFDLQFIKNRLKVDNNLLNNYISKMILNKNLNVFSEIKKVIDKILLTNNNIGKERKSHFDVFSLFKNIKLDFHNKNSKEIEEF